MFFQRLRAALPWMYLAGLVWLNAYLVRHVFSITYTGATQSMHGYWIALGRLVGDSWWRPGWLPFWAGGMPVELTYAPLVPWLGGHFGVYAVMAAAFAIGPAALFLMAWQLSGKPGWAFVTGVVYSLCSPTELFLPDGDFHWIHVLDARRLYLSFVWDEAPHQLALAMVCLAVAAWARGWRSAAIVAIAVGALANPFGVTGAALFGLCWLLVTGNWRMLALTGIWGYLIVCPFYPPSLLAVLRANGAMAPESMWTARSWVGLLAVTTGVGALWLLTRRWAPVRRFAVLLAWVATCLPVIYYKWNVVLLQQPGRYKSEMELALVLLAVFAIERLLAARPRWLLGALALVGIVAAEQQIVRHRRFSRNAVQQASPDGSIEKSAALAAQGYVFTVGSLAHWMNVYADVRQYAGGSFTTTPNPVQQRVATEMTFETSWERFVLFMRAVGVDGVILPGRNSAEFWKPFRNDVLAGHLPVLWEDRDTRLYQIPRTRRTQAHSIPGLIPLDQYVAAMEDPAAPALSMEWLNHNHGRVRGTWRPADMVLIHMNWHSGWQAYRNGKWVPTGADGLGQMVVVPGGNGELELRYEPGWTTRIVSVLALLALLAFAVWPNRRRAA